MPTFYSINSGNFSTGLATVVGDVSAAGTSGFLLTTTYSYPTTLATTTTAPIYGVAFQLSAVSGTPTGTIDIILSATDGNSTTASYPISDLTQLSSNANIVPGYPVGWQLFAFASPITFTSGRTMRVGVKTSVANKVSLMGASLANLNRSYVTNVLASPAAGAADVIHIVGSLSSTGLVSNTVNYNVNGLTTGNFYVHNGGVLNFSPSANVALTIAGSNGLQITPNGTVNIGTPSTPVLSSVTHNITLQNSFINVNNGGTFNVYGAYKTPYVFLTKNAVAGTGFFEVSGNTSNWVSPNSIILGPNSDSFNTFDGPYGLSVKSVSSIQLNTASNFSHISSNIVPGAFNITRNVSISGNTAYVRFLDGSTSNINNASFEGLRNTTYKGLQFGTNSTGTVLLSNCVFSSDRSASTHAFSSVSVSNPITNVSIKGCTFYNYGATTDIITLQQVSANNFSFTDNVVLSSSQNGMIIDRLSSTYADIKNNFLIGNTRNGLLVTNPYVLSGSIGGIGAMNGICGAVVSGVNVRSKFDGLAGHYNAQQGINISGNTPQLSSTVLSNMSGSFNKTFGFVLSGNPTSITSPATLNINGLVANNNVSGGFAAYSVCGNLSSMSFSNNSGADIRASLGSGDTIFDGITAINNNVVLSKDNTPALSTASPFGEGIDSSIYFDGTGTHTRILNSTNLDLSGTPFTIECWINADLSLNNNFGIFSKKEAAGNLSYQGYIGATTRRLAFQSGSTPYASTYVVPNNTWIHAAWVYDGTILSIYGNGVSALGANVTITNRDAALYLGAVMGFPNQSFVGCISNFRIVKGTALYTSNFTPPTAPLDIVPNTVLLYKAPYYGDNYSYDGVSLINAINPTLSSASPFDTGTDGSINFNGFSNFIRIPNTNNVFNLSATPFTIECWVYVTAINYSRQYTIFSIRNNTQVPVQGHITSANGYLALYSNANYVSTTVIPLSTWTHVAYVYNGSSILAYANGVSALSSSLTISNFSDLNLWLGGRNFSDFNEAFPGYISNFRFVRGTALYTSDFTPPTAPLDIVPNTALLYKAPYGNAYFYDSFSFINNYNSGIVLSGTNYSPTIIRNSKLIKNGYCPIALNSAKFEQFSVDSTTLSSNAEDFQALSRSNPLEGSYQFNNCTFGTGISSYTLDNYQDEVFLENGFVIMKENGIANNHYKMLRAGKISLDTTLAYGTNTISEKLEPISITTKLRCGSKMVPVNKNDTYTVDVYVRKSSGYTGDAPRLMLRRNAALGYDDTVLATSVGANGNWELLSGIVPVALDQGIFEVYVDCSGDVGSGSVNIDNWSLT
jgi:hypothetical protein